MSLLRACNADFVLSSVDLARVLFRTVGYMLSLLQFHFLMLSSNSGEKKKHRLNFCLSQWGYRFGVRYALVELRQGGRWEAPLTKDPVWTGS